MKEERGMKHDSREAASPDSLAVCRFHGWMKDAPATRVPDIADGDLKSPRLMGNGRLILPCPKKDDNVLIF